MTHKWTLSVSRIWFEYIRSGQKCYEGRRNRGIPSLIRVGDIIEFWNEDARDDAPVTAVVDSVVKARCFMDALQWFKSSLSMILPGVSSVEEATKIYEQYASVTSQRKHGVVLFKISINQ